MNICELHELTLISYMLNDYIFEFIKQTQKRWNDNNANYPVPGY